MLVTRAEAGKVTVGTDLFNFTNVLVGDIVVATAQADVPHISRGIFR